MVQNVPTVSKKDIAALTLDNEPESSAATLADVTNMPAISLRFLIRFADRDSCGNEKRRLPG
jgi:hypothetical protein